MLCSFFPSGNDREDWTFFEASARSPDDCYDGSDDATILKAPARSTGRASLRSSLRSLRSLRCGACVVRAGSSGLSAPPTIYQLAASPPAGRPLSVPPCGLLPGAHGRGSSSGS
jgi:hypothetical protein